MIKKVLLFTPLLIAIFLLVGCQNHNSSNSQEVKLVDFEASTCDRELLKSDPKINSIETKNQISIELVDDATCCVNLDGDIKVNNNQIELKIIESGEPCDCMCTHIFTFTIEGVNLDQQEIIYRGKKLN
jgi:hypothetical protein